MQELGYTENTLVNQSAWSLTGAVAALMVNDHPITESRNPNEYYCCLGVPSTQKKLLWF